MVGHVVDGRDGSGGGGGAGERAEEPVCVRTHVGRRPQWSASCAYRTRGGATTGDDGKLFSSEHPFDLVEPPTE